MALVIEMGGLQEQQLPWNFSKSAGRLAKKVFLATQFSNAITTTLI